MEFRSIIFKIAILTAIFLSCSDVPVVYDDDVTLRLDNCNDSQNDCYVDNPYNLESSFDFEPIVNQDDVSFNWENPDGIEFKYILTYPEYPNYTNPNYTSRVDSCDWAVFDSIGLDFLDEGDYEFTLRKRVSESVVSTDTTVVFTVDAIQDSSVWMMPKSQYTQVDSTIQVSLFFEEMETVETILLELVFPATDLELQSVNVNSVFTESQDWFFTESMTDSTYKITIFPLNQSHEIMGDRFEIATLQFLALRDTTTEIQFQDNSQFSYESDGGIVHPFNSLSNAEVVIEDGGAE